MLKTCGGLLAIIFFLGCEQGGDSQFVFEEPSENYGIVEQALAADEPTNVTIDPRGNLVGDFKICRVRYMGHIWAVNPEVDLGLFEMQTWGYFHQGRCMRHNVPFQQFEVGRSLIIGRDGRFTIRFDFPIDYYGEDIVPFRDTDVPSAPAFGGDNYIGQRILSIKLVPDATIFGGYRVASLSVKHNLN